MSSTLREAAQQALEALKDLTDAMSGRIKNEATALHNGLATINALRAALAYSERDWSLLDATQKSLREWHLNTVTPEHDTKAFVLWVDTDRVHTASWLDGRWITSSGYTVWGMGEVKAWAKQPSIEDVLVHGVGSDYERGFVAGMSKQASGSVDRAVNSISRKPLRDLTIADIYVKWDATPGASMADFARAIEAAHGIK